MKKFLSLIIITILIVVMLIVQLPTIALATNISDMVKSIIKDNKSKMESNDNEVIVMYKDYTASDSILKRAKQKSLLDDLTIEDTVEFDTTPVINEKDAEVKIMSTNKEKENIKVSLVSSDKYSSDVLIKKLSNDSSIIYAEKNCKVKASSISNDTYEKFQWAIENAGQNAGTTGLDINPEKVNTTSKKEKVIAILDSGIDYTNPELADKMWVNTNTKKIKGTHGYDFENDDDDPLDDNGHGTHCAGIIAAKSNNNQGITGAILEDTNIKLMALKFLDEEGYGSSFSAISAYNYIYRAQKLGVNVVAVNNSWGVASENDKILKMVIELVGAGKDSDGKGALSICAAGNERLNNDKDNIIPANIDSDYVISVAASNEKDELASFSDYGKESVDIAAPGTDILSTVSYNVFNPTIYDDKNSICSEYNSFDDGVGGFTYRTSPEANVTSSSNEFFGTSGKSLEWKVNMEENGTYYLAIPCNNITKGQRLSEMIKFTSIPDGIYDEWMEENVSGEMEISFLKNEIDEIDFENISYQIGNDSVIYTNVLGNSSNYWKHIETELNKSGTLIIVVNSFVDGELVINLDDFAISKANLSEDTYGKYKFYNGTSMATPFVTAAVAIASNYIDDEKAIDRKARVLGSSRKVEQLKDYIATSGVLDLNNLALPTPTIKSIKIDKDGLLTINAVNFGDNPVLTINNKNYTPKIVDDNTITIIDKDLINTIANIKIITNGKEVENKVYLAVGEKYKSEPKPIYNYVDSLITDGNKLYMYTIERSICEYITDEYGSYISEITRLNNENLKNIIGDKSSFITEEIPIYNSDFVIVNNKIYVLLTFDFDYARDYVLASYDLNSGIWEKVTDMPDDYDLLTSNIVNYKDKIYIIGGYDINTKKTSSKVYEVDLSNNKLNATSSIGDLPEGRFEFEAKVVDEKIIIAFGGNDEGTVPTLLIYDGNKWNKSSATIDIKEPTLKVNNKNVYYAGSGIVSGGVLFSGIKAEKYGDTFYYDIKTDQFKSYGYVLGEKNYIANSVGDKYYVACNSKYDEDSYISDLKCIPIKPGIIEYVKNVKLNKTSVSLSAFDTLTLKASVSNSNATNKTLKWSSSNTNYATVSKNGKVTPKAAGVGKTVTIKVAATDGSGKTASCKVKITKPKVKNLKVTSTTKKQINLKWDKISGTQKYEVYMYNTSAKKYKLYKSQTGNTIKIKKLKSNKKYKFKVLANKKIDGKYVYSDYAKVTGKTKK